MVASHHWLISQAREPNVLEWKEVEYSRWRPQTGSGYGKRLFPFPHLIATRFQHIYLCFWGLPYQWDMYLYCTTKLGGSRKWKIKDGGLHPWNAYISPPRLASNAIPTAMLMFRGQPYQWDMYLYCTTKLEETGSAKSKIAAYTHEMHIFQLPD